MPRCILHAGMPKTGTSSIQESLYYGLEDPCFRYLGFGEVNGSRAVATLFGRNPEHYFWHRYHGIDAAAVARYRRRLLSRAETTCARAAQDDATVIVSAEQAWDMDSQELAALRTFFQQRGFEVDVLLYIRAWKPWLESLFQQMVKLGRRRFDVMPAGDSALLSHEHHVRRFEDVFGTSQVTLAVFDPARLQDGCVVRDFCRRVGIPDDSVSVRRANDSLSLDALKLLYAHRRFGGDHGTGLRAVFENLELVRRLEELRGPSIRFHSSLLAAHADFIHGDHRAIEARLGEPFPPNMHENDDGPCIRSEEELFGFSHTSLRWLGRQVGLPPLAPGDGENKARAVAVQVARLRARPGLAGGLHRAGEVALRTWRHLTRGV